MDTKSQNIDPSFDDNGYDCDDELGGQDPMSDDCSFESSGGVFPLGYAVWRIRFGHEPQLLACRCRPDCEPAVPGGLRSAFDGQIIKHGCQLKDPPEES